VEIAAVVTSVVEIDSGGGNYSCNNSCNN